VPTPYYRLRIKSLKFISAVDHGAQGPISNVALIKRAPGGDEIEAVCKVVLASEPLGLVFGWALANTLDGGRTPHVDLQEDAIVGDDELIKVAAAFMESGGASDVLHGDAQDGKVLFCLPLTGDVLKALHLQSDVHGLAIGMRPSPETFQRFLSGELNAFSIAGTGEREVVKAGAGKCPGCGAAYGAGDKYCASCGMKKRVAKQAVFTDEVDGHQHVLDLDDPACEWRDSYATSSQTAAGAAQSHSHAWTFDPQSGAVTVAADSGHNHTVSVVVPSDVLAAAVLNEAAERKRRAERNAQAAAEAVGSGTVAVTITAVEARAPAGISTPAQPAPTVQGNSQENAPMDPKFAKMLATALALPEPHRLHVAKLGPEDQAAFLGLSPADQDSAVKAAEAADPEVYKTAAGISIRKSHGPLAEQMARQADTTAAELAKQAQQLAIEKAERARVTLEKRASDLIPLIGASLAERVAIIKAVDGIAEEGTRNGALEALKGANEAFRLLGVPHGAGGDSVPENKSPRKAWDDGLAGFAKSKNIANPLDAIVPFLKTEQGQTLRKALDAQRPLAQAS
jgi:hypothetical protein